MCRFPLNTWQTVYPNPNPKCSLLRSRKEAPVHSGRLAPRSPRRRQHYLQRLSRVRRGDLQSPPTVKRNGKTAPLDDARTYPVCGVPLSSTLWSCGWFDVSPTLDSCLSCEYVPRLNHFLLTARGARKQDSIYKTVLPETLRRVAALVKKTS